MPSSSPHIITPNRSWFQSDIALVAAAASAAIDEAVKKLDCDQSMRLLVPTNCAGEFLAAMLGCKNHDVTAIPYSESKGKTIADLSPLLAPHAILRFESGRPCIEPLSAGDNAVREFPHYRGNVILTTTGSTGAPKGVCLDIDRLLLNALAAGTEVGLNAGDHWLVETDLSLTSGLCHLLMAWTFGCAFVHAEHDKLLDYLQTDGAGRAYGFGGSPIQLSKLADRGARIHEPFALMSSGDFLTLTMINKCRGAFPKAAVHKFYGLTELSGRFCALSPEELDDFPDAVGRPLTGLSMRVVDDSGRIAETGVVGEVQARSPMLMYGYLRPERRFEATDPCAWFPTGDLGSVDKDGRLTLHGRKNLSFKVGGEKVDTFTVETCLEAVLAGHNYCALPVPHPALGQCLGLFVEAGPEAQRPLWRIAVTHISRNLPSRYIPMFGYAVECFPRLENGKVDRKTLIENVGKYSRLP